MHPAVGHARGTLVNALIAHCGDSLSGIGGIRRPGIVHRLDKDTSGLLVAAKTDAAHRFLAKGFSARTLSRTYQALVWGMPVPKAGEFRGNIGRSPKNRKKMAVLDSGGRPARTHYRVLGAVGGGHLALVECRLESGRTHQIRVHLAHSGHPVVGDRTYGHAPTKRLQGIDGPCRQAISDLTRQFLHATRLEFCHPISGAERSFSVPLPLELNKILTTCQNKICVSGAG